MTGLRQMRPLAPPAQQNEAIDLRRFAFPYAIVLPARLAGVLTETSPVPVREQFGQHHAVFLNESQMRQFLTRLARHRERDVAGVILAGIRSSL